MGNQSKAYFCVKVHLDYVYLVAANDDFPSRPHGHLCAPSKSLSLCFSPCCCCKEASEAEKIKESCQKKRKRKFLCSHPSCEHHPLPVKRKKKFNEKMQFASSVFINFFKVVFFFFMHRVVIEIHARGNLSDSRNCMIVFRSLLPSLHSVMSVIILFSFIASLTQLFI